MIRTRLYRTITGLVAPVAVLTVAVPVGAQQSDRYDDCLALSETKPEEAFETALAWRDAGGGVPARHCAAVALISLEQYEQAGLRLETLADDMRAERVDLRAEVLSQAGNAWLLAGNNARAVATFTAALDLLPEDADLLIDRGRALAAAENYGEAFSDLDRALAFDPTRADALVYRAAARRQLDDTERAMEDIELALALEPLAVDALVERGILRRLGGDSAGARADWLKVLELSPDTQAGEIARRNLELMDVRTE